MKWFLSTRVKLALAIAVSSLVSAGFWAVGAIANHSWDFWYLNWNLVLAWTPLGIMVLLERVLRRHLWSDWQAMVLTVLFLIFLPNTFYMITDIIHLQDPLRVDLIYDVAMFMSFIFSACVLGLLCLFMLHGELRKRLSQRLSWLMVSGTIFLVSFAIYIGRDLRWNTWDVVLNPASILFEISERLLHPAAHPEVFTTTISFFVLITSLYAVVWYAARTARRQKTLD